MNLKNYTFSNRPFNFFYSDNFLSKNDFKYINSSVNGLFSKYFIDPNQKIIKDEIPERFIKSKKKGKLLVVGGNASKFNSLEMIANAINSNNKRINDMLDLLKKPKLQKKFYRILIPFKFNDLISLKPFKLHNENSKLNFFDFLFFRNCHLKLKLSSYSSNAGLFQHVDHPDKITALLLYFGFSDTIIRKGLGTQIYEVKKGFKRWSADQNYTLDYLENDKLIMFADIDPLPNRIFGFRVSKNSWHGVEPAILPENVFRSALQMNLYKHKNYSLLTSKFISILKFLRKILIR